MNNSPIMDDGKSFVEILNDAIAVKWSKFEASFKENEEKVQKLETLYSDVKDKLKNIEDKTEVSNLEATVKNLQALYFKNKDKIRNLENQIAKLTLRNSSLEEKVQNSCNPVFKKNSETVGSGSSKNDCKNDKTCDMIGSIGNTFFVEKEDKFKQVTKDRLTSLENKVYALQNKVLGPSTKKEQETKEKTKVYTFEENKDVVTYCQYPPNVNGNVAITNEDYLCLAASQFLNDSMIDFFLQYLKHSKNGRVNDELISKTHIFSTFFYGRLSSKPSTSKGINHPVDNVPSMSLSDEIYEKVKKWTKNIDLLQMDFVVIPINEKLHWFVCIVCFPGEVLNTFKEEGEVGSNSENFSASRNPCILVFDSLPEDPKKEHCSLIRSYLTSLLRAKDSKCTVEFTEENMPQYNPRVRRQKNSKDCGIFLLQYVESFFRDPDREWGNPNCVHSEWFQKEETMNKRGHIAKLIQKLAIRQHKEKNTGKKLSFPPLDFEYQESPKRNNKDTEEKILKIEATPEKKVDTGKNPHLASNPFFENNTGEKLPGECSKYDSSVLSNLNIGIKTLKSEEKISIKDPRSHHQGVVFYKKPCPGSKRNATDQQSTNTKKYKDDSKI